MDPTELQLTTAKLRDARGQPAFALDLMTERTSNLHTRGRRVGCPPPAWRLTVAALGRTVPSAHPQHAKNMCDYPPSLTQFPLFEGGTKWRS